MHNTPRPVLSAILLALAVSTAHGESVKIVAAENFYGGIAELIDPHATVTSILTNPNQDPHEFTTNAATARAVAEADIVIMNGISYDPWMEKLLATGGKPGRTVIRVADLLGAKEGDNPHLWYEPKTMPALAARLAETLTRLHPDQAGTYQQRLAEFNQAMQPVREKIAALRSRTAGLTVTATEPVFGYMTAALGFKMLNEPFQWNIMNETEPGADQTAAFEQSLTAHTARILFYNRQVTDPVTERMRGIAVAAGIPIVGVCETEPPEQPSYVAWMMQELDDVQAALAVPSLK